MLTLRKLSQKIKDMNKFVTMCIQGTNASETGQADRRYRAVYELFSYFYRNLFLSRNFNSVTNNLNNSYDISDYARI